MVMMDGCPTISPSPQQRPSAVSQEMLNHRLRPGGVGRAPLCRVCQFAVFVLLPGLSQATNARH